MKENESESSSWANLSIAFGIIGFAIFKSSVFFIFGLLGAAFFSEKK